MRQYFAWFWQFWRQSKLAFSGVFLLTFASITVKTAFPIMLKFIMDRLAGDFVLANMAKMIGLYFVFAIFHELISMSLPVTRHYMNVRIAMQVRNKYFGEFTKKVQRFFGRFKTGDLLTRLTDDVDGNWDRIAWYSCSGVLRPVEAILVLAFTLSVMFSFHWQLTLFTFIPVPVLVWLLAVFEEKMMRYTEIKQAAISRCNDTLQACFSGIRIVKSSLSERDQISKYAEALEDRVGKEKDFLKINQLVHLFAMLVNNIGSIIVIFVGSYYMVKGSISLGTFLLFIIYLDRLIEPVWTLSFFYASSKQVFKYVDRLQETEDESLNMSSPGKQHIGQRFESLTLCNLQFAYGERTLINAANLQFRRGEKIAIIGPVGSGKSTLLQLISGALRAEAGQIFVNNTDITKAQPSELHAIIGRVEQESLLFSESIHENIVLGDKIDKAGVEAAVQQSLLAEEIRGFAEGYETSLGQFGVRLSGGQKQRLSIARSLARKPQLLLLDDCTAAMDAETESRFWHGIHESFPELSVILVSHRKNSVRNFDRVYRLYQQQLTEIRHEDLGLYL